MTERPKAGYVVELVHGHGMDMDTLKIVPTVQAVVKFSADGMIAWRGPSYVESQAARNIRAVAGKQRARWQNYYDRTGRRFEVEEADKRAAARAERDAARAAKQRLREAAPDLLARLKDALWALDNYAALVPSGAEVSFADPRQAIRETIEKVEG